MNYQDQNIKKDGGLAIEESTKKNNIVDARNETSQAKSSVADIGSRLIEKKVISEDQLEIALKEQLRLKNTKTISAILVDMGFVSEGALGEILNETTGTKKFDIKSSIIDSKLVKRVPKEFAINNKLMPISHDSHSISIAMADVFDIVAIDQVKRFFPPHFKLNPVYVPEVDILHALDQYHSYEMSIEGILKEIENIDIQAISNESDLRGDYKSPMVRLVDAILTDAVHRAASDIHFEPENSLVRWFRFALFTKSIGQQFL
jgi:hypothetical protein